MQIYFKSRQAARDSKVKGKIVDNGPQAVKRWGRDISDSTSKKVK